MTRQQAETMCAALKDNGFIPLVYRGSGDFNGALEVHCMADKKYLEENRTAKSVTPFRILKSGNRTIVFWADGTKTIVKRAEDEEDNDYAAFTAALGIKLYGSNSALKRIVERTETQKPKEQKRETGIELPKSVHKKEQKEDDPNG